jgi:hypothetical protein
MAYDGKVGVVCVQVRDDVTTERFVVCSSDSASSDWVRGQTAPKDARCSGLVEVVEARGELRKTGRARAFKTTTTSDTLFEDWARSLWTN